MGYPLFAFTWIESQLVPACLLSKLRTLEVGYLHAHKEEDQLKLIKYFLKNAKVLEDMSISCPEDIDTTQIRMKFVRVPSGFKSAAFLHYCRFRLAGFQYRHILKLLRSNLTLVKGIGPNAISEGPGSSLGRSLNILQSQKL
ncbi:hypothetical protein RJ639_005602 [Escallonia herrerae]|uniref:FBD domain-containing protein n=1 Tax=Escallonia herrerae TaxID=1293975 RepID=A0AA88VVY9_9ASTE|nr:hypothetical protein RJ639_005602 [Escallonia herrerae]